MLFQALDNRLTIDALTNPSNGGRYVHGPMRVIVRIWLVAANIRKRLNDFLSGNAGVKLSHYPSPVALRSGLRTKRSWLVNGAGLNRRSRWQFQPEITR